MIITKIYLIQQYQSHPFHNLTLHTPILHLQDYY